MLDLVLVLNPAGPNRFDHLQFHFSSILNDYLCPFAVNGPVQFHQFWSTFGSIFKPIFRRLSNQSKSTFFHQFDHLQLDFSPILNDYLCPFAVNGPVQFHQFWSTFGSIFKPIFRRLSNQSQSNFWLHSLTQLVESINNALGCLLIGRPLVTSPNKDT